MMYVRQDDLQELVGDDGAAIREAKEGVVSEDRTDSHGAGVHDAFMAQGTERPVAVHQRDVLAQEDLAQDGEGAQHSGQGHLVVEGQHGQVVHLQSSELSTDRSGYPVRPVHCILFSFDASCIGFFWKIMMF